MSVWIWTVYLWIQSGCGASFLESIIHKPFELIRIANQVQENCEPELLNVIATTILTVIVSIWPQIKAFSSNRHMDNADTKDIKQILHRYFFNVIDLYELSIRTNIPPNTIQETTPAEMIEQLVLYCYQNGKLSELKTQIRNQRPKVNIVFRSD